MLSVACKNDNIAYLLFSNYLPFFIHFWSIIMQLLEIFSILGRITEQISGESHMQD